MNKSLKKEKKKKHFTICQDICDLMLGTYVNLELANPLTKHTLLIIRQIQDVFNALRNKVSSSSVKAVQVYPRNNEEVLDFKARQLAFIEV